MVDVQAIERELVNREHELIEAIKDVETPGIQWLTQALYRVREAIAHVKKAQEKA